MRDHLWIQIIAPIEFLVAKGTARQGYGGGSKHGIPLALRVRRWVSVERWRVRCSDRSKPLEQGWQGSGFDVDLGARTTEQTGKGEGCWRWCGSDGTGEVRIGRVVGADDKGGSRWEDEGP